MSDRSAHRGTILGRRGPVDARQNMTASFRGKPIDWVIDVRSHLEFWLGHLKGATCIPVGNLADALAKRDDIPQDARILLYCASGSRSAAAAGVLRSLGYTHVIDGGGMGAAEANYTV
jgi:phage shock protein E